MDHKSPVFTENLSEAEILQEALSCGIVNMGEISAAVEDMKRKEVLSQHDAAIWQNKQGMYLTHIIDASGKRVIRRRKTLRELEDMLIAHYASLIEEIYIKDVFEAWLSDKIRYGEITKQSHDRYLTDYKRFFRSSESICRKKFKNITPDDLDIFIKSKIHDLSLTRHAYSGLVTLLRGIFKYGKRKGYTDLSITQYFGDLELSKNMFRRIHRDKEEETFSEEETPVILSYLKENVDVWNMALLLQFETGMRIGEIVALKWEDIEDTYIRVRRTEYKYLNNDKWCFGVKDQTKTEAGERKVYYPPQTKWTLDRIRELKPQGDFLFLNPKDGKRLRGNYVNRRLTRICENLGLTHHSTHKVRKTYGTALLDGKVDDSFVAEQMGHRDVNTTRKLYYYSNKSEKTKIAQITNAISF